MMTAATDTINTTTINDIHNRFDRPPQQAQSHPLPQQQQHNIIRTSPPPQSQQAIYSSSVIRRTTMNDPPGRTALDDVYNNTDYDDSDNMHQDCHDNDKNESNHHQDNMTFDWSSISSIGDDHSRYDDDEDDEYDNYDNYNDNDDDMIPDRTITSTTTGDVIVEASASTVIPTQHDQQRTKKHVTFGMVETYEVQSLKDYETDDKTNNNNNNNTSFWYSSYEMLSTRKAGRILCITDPNVRNFLYYYEYLYRKLISDDDHVDHEDKVNTMETTDSDTATSNITALDTKILAYGLCDGYQGLERESSFEVYRQKERREVVRMILDVHHSMKDKQLDTNNNDDELLRSYALSLTTKMSYWAYCIGQAGHLASNEDALYQTTNVIA